MPRVESVEIVSESAVVHDLQVADDHSFIVAGVVVHNSQICMGLDGQVFAYDDPNRKVPPQHYNCRSVTTANVKWEELGIEPPEPGTRQAPGGQVSAQTTYEDWLSDQTEDVQNDILGPGRAKLFREDKVGLKDLITKDNRRRTLDQLRG